MTQCHVLTGAALDAALGDVARLRIAVFRDWPYLYDGDLDYERRYLAAFRASPQAVVVGAYDGNTLVGAATAAPLSDHADDFAQAFDGTGVAIDDVFYCAESVLLAGYRGQGIGHRFFDAREDAARAFGYTKSAFCAVQRPDDHPLRPAGYRPLDTFWRKRGYAPLDGAIAQFTWKDVDADAPTAKPLQVWIKDL
ncbi:GNAT family N-acetyltransferase [Pseudosulfitobacter pseudonitzschiae]|uniref:GNAT family N-acetyltransferase n=1 Tax=Pseudosulfitobacter pseudonitzschiae TaxID=1402135 RepID=UPI001AF88E6A|nr:GNAT family N-acetyltransferase [Pseudosulfitobacter pseudonitzschiae]MBM1816179.1 GNAT family N-acetyltransferase [Pseudosulfitobacter pseudonitzschiae]MBM1833670.1 GNAT family N-acetyltransferase [Pseudosulfitobacter pseudonitzschiae]MBM1838536.1 GNAT family N-acetyltransferase [Pseudosulfitobacter pseudonitzschiae]MBM1842884.1 GNAT family N-acetyltransferase [Pseudosulfitobacter pseudonitzschiae]MBM1847750.1 GNAT family N-acetyltransferase [Pseudosulfitobacter pseudonitzschiae]